MPFSAESISLDRESPVPLYYQVAQELERAIDAGDIAAGTRLENEIVLAKKLDLSRLTLRRAVEYLVDRGLVIRRRGAGTVVVHPQVRRPIELSSLYEDLARDGRRPSTKVLTIEPQPAPDQIAHAFNLDEGVRVLTLERLRYAGDEPLALLRNYLPLGLVDLTAEALESGGLYQLLRAAGIRLQLASQTVGARLASAADARALHERKGAPLLTMQRHTYDELGRPVEVAHHVYRAALYSLEFVLSARSARS
jgi:DNA-binding GntR family transcriptional regulator